MSKVEIIKRPLEQIGISIKKNAWASVIKSILIVVFGILIVVWPDITISIIANILGAIFIVNGIYQIVNYFVVKGQNDFFNNGLLFGVISLLVGIAAIVIGVEIASVFRIIIGIWIIYEALVRINTSIKMHAIDIKAWSYVLIIALFMLAIGLFVVFNTGAVIQMIGGMMILSGIIGIIGDVLFIQHLNNIVDILTKKTEKQ